ncbi:MAG: S1 RNA-binding domain-containing protein, partial [Chitinivibrionales bacterium]|nr:S1 RNA-binding domain-containing protein [Chitinivibrionales bacterium]
NTPVIKSINKNSFVSENIGLPTITDILAELEKPGRDPRRTFEYARFSDTIREIADLKEGLLLEGAVTNVTNFGAFVDIGVHQDGLVHISEMSNSFVKDPKTVVKVGQVVTVRVLKIDPQLKRIALSMKTGEAAVRNNPPPASTSPLPPKKAGEKKLFMVKPKLNVRQFMN